MRHPGDQPPVPALPVFLEGLARRAEASAEPSGARGAQLVHAARAEPDNWEPRRSAVLVLIAGTSLEDAEILLEERSHRMRSQPGQFALPGGRAELEDIDDAATALREAHEETGLDPSSVRVLGAFASIPMPWRGHAVTPVVAWAPARPMLGETDGAEVERLLWAPLRGRGALSDPGVHRRGLLDGRAVGAAFDLPGEAFVWGLTAAILDGVLRLLGLPGAAPDAATVEIPALRRAEACRRGPV